jgi:hypothetical protein
MKTAAWLRRRALLAYFALAYGPSWGGILMILAANSFDLTDLRPVDTGLIFVAMLLGPSVAGLALTALLEGRSGMHELGARLVRWRYGRRWYAVALLTMPISLLAVLWSLGIAVDAVFAPRFQWPMFAIGLAAGCC